MTERKPHADNDLIDELDEAGGAPDQGGRSIPVSLTVV